MWLWHRLAGGSDGGIHARAASVGGKEIFEKLVHISYFWRGFITSGEARLFFFAKNVTKGF